MFFGAYDPNTEFHLGYYGIDTVNNRIWAVLDHNSQYGVGGVQIQDVPEPGTMALMGIGTLALWFRMTRQRQRL